MHLKKMLDWLSPVDIIDSLTSLILIKPWYHRHYSANSELSYLLIIYDSVGLYQALRFQFEFKSVNHLFLKLTFQHVDNLENQTEISSHENDWYDLLYLLHMH